MSSKNIEDDLIRLKKIILSNEFDYIEKLAKKTRFGGIVIRIYTDERAGI